MKSTANQRHGCSWHDVQVRQSQHADEQQQHVSLEMQKM
jgi:hypothetical protein